MIPKIIHYIWFGGNPYPPKVQYCMETWRKYLPDYEFHIWNEDTFDVNSIQFTKEAYANKKWAFVSDYVRVYALHKYGGWYLDTDVEVLRSLDGLSNHKMVLGTDDGGYLSVVMGSEPQHFFWSRMLDLYSNLKFINPDGSLNQEVNNTYLQNELGKFGYVIENKLQKLDDDIIIFPDDYLHVCSLTSGKRHLTENSYTIHWHTLLWINKKTRFIRFLRMHILVPILGADLYTKLANHFKR